MLYFMLRTAFQTFFVSEKKLLKVHVNNKAWCNKTFLVNWINPQLYACFSKNKIIDKQ